MMLVKKIRYRLKWAWNDLPIFRQKDLKLPVSPGTIRVFCLHGVCEDHEPYINGRFMRKSQLRNLLIEMKKHFHFLTAGELERNQIDKSKLNVLLTTDDGYRNNTTLLLPLLEELELPAVFFVTGQHKDLWMDLFDVADYADLDLDAIYREMELDTIGSNKLKQAIINARPEKIQRVWQMLSVMVEPLCEEYSTFLDLLSDEDLKTLSEHELIELGNHTDHHYNLVGLDDNVLKDEVERLALRFQQNDLTDERRIAPPFARYNERLIEQLNKLGYKHVYVDQVLPGTESKVIGRITANPFISLRNQVKAINNGRY